MNVAIKSNSGMHEVGLNALLLGQRVIYLTGEVNEAMALNFAQQAAYMNSEDDKAPIKVFIDSNGGSVQDGLTIYDIIQGSPAPMKLYCMGKAYSMAAVLFASGQHGRYMMPHSQLMIHEPLIQTGVAGKTSSIQTVAESMLRTKKQLAEILAQHTKQPLGKLEKVMKEDTFFTAQQAVEFGLAEGVKGFGDMMMGGRA